MRQGAGGATGRRGLILYVVSTVPLLRIRTPDWYGRFCRVTHDRSGCQIDAP